MGEEIIFKTPEDVKGDGTPCSSIRQELKFCIRNTDCVKEGHRTPRDCMQSRDPSIPDQCYRLAHLLFECKRSVMDNRARFRGRKGYVDH